MFKETLLPLDDGAFLAMTLDGRASHDPQLRDPDLAYAYEALPDGTSRDVFALVTEALPGDGKLSTKHASQAKSQDEAAQHYAGKKLEAQLRDNAARERRLAELALVDSRRLPTDAWYLGDRQLLLEYQEHTLPRWYRVVSLVDHTELARFDASMLCNAVQTKPLDADMPVVSALKFKVLAARGEHLLVDGGLTRALMRRRSGGFERRVLVDCRHGGWRAGAATARGFLCEIESEMDQHELLHIDISDDCAVSRWPCKRRVSTSFAAAAVPGAPAALGSIGGTVVLLNMTTGLTDMLPPFLGLHKDDAPDVRVSPDGRYVVAFQWDGKRIGAFDTATGTCVVLDVPPPEVIESKGLRQVRTADAAATVADLVTLSRGQLTRVPWTSLAWQSPPAAVAKLKKGKSPLDTIAMATRSGPLKPVAELVQSWYAPSIALLASRLGKDTAVGVSKFNGLPDLAAGTAWPRWRGVPMAFLAQIDCASAKTIAPELALPNRGWLSFFLGLDPGHPMPSFHGEVNTDREGARVFYSPADAGLTRLAMPQDMPSAYRDSHRPVCKLKLVRGGAVLPDLTHPAVALARLAPAQAQAYQALAQFVNGDDEDSKQWGSRLGGYPAVLQHDSLALTAESFERGDGSPSGRGWDDPAFQRASATWCQLMQMAGGEEEWIWGDGGLMHWMVRRGDLDNAQFSPAWAIGVN